MGSQDDNAADKEPTLARDTTSTPGRVVRKTRGKYTSRACTHCRKRKLKCSGENPCQRCAAHRIRCSFPLPLYQRPLDHAQLVGDSNGGQPTQSNDQDANAMDMGSRIKNIEDQLQTLIQLLPKGDERGSVEPQQPDEDDGYQGDTTFNAPVDAFSARLNTLRQQLGCSDTSSPSRNDDSVALGSTSASPVTNKEKTGTIRYGSRILPFPESAEYSAYLDMFFKDINACHPCVNEAEFSSKCQKIVATRSIDLADACFLAMNYIIFACADILRDVGSVPKRRIPGWNWYQTADNLMNKRKISGRGDLSLIQFLAYETFYLVHADRPNAAYNVSGLACRLCFQFGLHQQRLWESKCTPFSRHMRQRLFWTVYFVDRRTSLSCGRPYGIRDSDVAVDLPEWIDDKALYPDRPIPAPDPDASFNIFLACVTTYARFAGEIWDQIFSVQSQEDTNLLEKIIVIDARIKYWLDTVLPTMPLRPRHTTPTQRHLWQETLVRTRMNHLRLLLRRRTMVSLSYTATDGRVCGDVAIDIVGDLQTHAAEAQNASSLRFHMAFSLGGAILILATLLCRDLTVVNLQDQRPSYIEAYKLGISMLRSMSSHLHTANRILDDLKDITSVVDMLLENSGPGPIELQTFHDVVPPNVENLFPYDDSGNWDPFLGAESMEAPSQAANDPSGLWDSWDNEFVWSQSGHIPWV